MKTILFLFATLTLCSTSIAQIIYLEDFSNVTMTAPAMSITNTVTGGPMTPYNVDGLIPAGSVDYVTDAWVIREDFADDPSDTVAFSTSWYSPAGQADDWMVTPSIEIPLDGAILSWDAKAEDPNFPDGYSVYVSTGTNSVVDLTANPPIFTIAAESDLWTGHNVDLSPYAGQPIFIGFRNNSNDQFLLLIDDILVEEGPLGFDAAISDVKWASEYFNIDLNDIRNCPFELGVTVSNEGDTLTDVVVCCNVYRDSLVNPLATFVSDTVSKLSPGLDTSVSFNDTAYYPNKEGVYFLEYIVKVAENDDDNSNDTFYVAQIIQDSTMWRDVSVLDGALGIGTTSPGVLGQSYTLKQPDILYGVDIFLAFPTIGDTFSVAVYNTDPNTGEPTTEIIQTPTRTVTLEDSNAFVRVNLPVPLFLTPGTYFIGVNESTDNNISIGYSFDIFTPGATWVIFGANPWQNSEFYGFPIAYIMRPFFETCKDSFNLESTILASDSSDIKYEAAINITSTDTISAGAMEILYDSGGDIDLLPGFNVELGAIFEAFIDGCGGLRGPTAIPDKFPPLERRHANSRKYPVQSITD